MRHTFCFSSCFCSYIVWGNTLVVSCLPTFLLDMALLSKKHVKKTRSLYDIIPTAQGSGRLWHRLGHHHRCPPGPRVLLTCLDFLNGRVQSCNLPNKNEVMAFEMSLKTVPTWIFSSTTDLASIVGLISKEYTVCSQARLGKVAWKCDPQRETNRSRP